MLSLQELEQVFPTPASGLVFAAYMAMFVAQGLLVTRSRHGSVNYGYNTTTVVLLTETLKLLLSLAIYLWELNLTSLVQTIRGNRWVLILYLVPSSLYCLYNNLAFYSLSYFNPTSYFMFMQIRLLITGVIYQMLFKKRLSYQQWFSLALLTGGCMLHASGSGGAGSSSANSAAAIHSLGDLATGAVFILVQVLCSVIAGVYNEYIIKGEGADVHIMVQNVFMYVDSILCNIFFLAFKGELLTAFKPESLSSVGELIVLAIILNNAVLGIVTSLFLKKLNSVLKAVASALELVFTALLSLPVLGIPLSWETVVAIIIISLAVLIYAKHPVPSQPSTQPPSEKA